METRGRLADRVALVFGAGSVGEGWGNGKAAAVAYARAGARVVAVDRDPQAAQSTCELIRAEGGDALDLQADVIDLDQIRSVVDQALARYGRIDVLHNNVGITSRGGPVETGEDVWDRVMAVNVKSMFLTCKAVLPHMEARGRGAIVNIGALGGVRWAGYAYCAYAASKGAVNSLTQSVALQYAAKGIRANCILPGVMDTPHIYQQIAGFYPDAEDMVAARNRLSPTGRMGDGWDVAHAAVFLASDEARYINGVELFVDGGLHARCN
ncbi:SDR family NAD(P)-dependent oxidoreductase [Castellaniella defragrans]|jgi:NAD(P)-dependent dehydrogenase (short-subunit alcohol dehydrogenase family)|uniref:NAD(P)-dependent dehydrogenase (Short-subunit alcohol dehydrogenase family) n=1 Tax=Castellaniella defragrans TaxID=75697 RepID=A0A7W9TPW9_CASDE|nr:glucose 1-dehydrogenase [Castellaniella defragrans]KAB0616321.1 glucose 1-dehydrogenase [Castellaniella defragrans]MBB6083803.1 NAD(P)-dependent dehydrogenase (short-subunit alcohol dehydrogenase family) [Castellaniella defragrans]